MKFLVDAQLPRKLCGVLAKHGHDAVHTLDLPSGNQSTDSSITRKATDDTRVVVSKDIDFFYSHTVHGRPEKLLLVKTGNMSVRDLCSLLERNIDDVIGALETHSLVEIDKAKVTSVSKSPGK